MSQTETVTAVATNQGTGPGVPNVAKRSTWRAKFIRNLRKDGNITRAARLAGITTRQAYRVRKQSERFAKAWDEALEESCQAAYDATERFVRHHAIRGFKKPIVHNGEIVGFERKYDNRLALRILEAEKPSKYAPRNSSQGSTVNVQVNVAHQQAMLTNPEMLELQCRMDALLAASSGRALEGPGSDSGAGTTDLPS